MIFFFHAVFENELSFLEKAFHFLPSIVMSSHSYHLTGLIGSLLDRCEMTITWAASLILIAGDMSS